MATTNKKNNIPLPSLDELREQLAEREAQEQKHRADAAAAEIEQQRLRAHLDAQSRQDVDMLAIKSRWYDFGALKNRYYRRFKQNKIIICNFELENGHHTTCLLPIHNGAITFNKKSYIIDDSLKYYHLGYREWCYDYHESFSMPIQRKIPINTINAAVQESKIGNIAYATNPLSLKTFQINEVVRSSIQAAGITDFFKQVRLLVIISALASVIMLILWAHKEGYFSGITG